MSKIINFWKKLGRNDTFLKILSVLIAILAWFWIVSIAKPSNEKEFSKIPVQIVYEDSTPSKNQLMMKLVDKEFFVNAVIEGPRSNLFTLAESGIVASFDFSKVAAPGAASVPIEITLSDKNLVVKDYSPKYVTMEFTRSYSKEFNIEIAPKGTLPSGHVITEQKLEIQTLTIKGPEDEVKSIDCIRVIPDFTDKTQSFTADCELEILDKDGERVDRSYLTIEKPTILTTITMEDQKQIPVKVNIFDQNGVNITGKVNISFSPPTLLLQSSKEKLDTILEIRLEDIALTEPLTQAKSISVQNLPNLADGVKYINSNEVTVMITPIPQ